MRFAKAVEQNFSTQISRLANVVDRQMRVVDELQDLNGTPSEDQVYAKNWPPYE